MKIAVAQSSSVKGDVNANIDNHVRYIEQASLHGVNYLIFPELSLTGYEMELAKELVFKPNDERLGPLIDAAVKYNITVGVGAPIQSKGSEKIGLFIIHNTGQTETYEKIYLHEGEDVYFSSGDQYRIVQLEQETIANAICADTVNSIHAKTCVELGASIYAAGVLVTPDGYAKDSKMWAGYADEYKILVAIANFNKPSGGLPAAGKSAIWYKGGLLAQAGEAQDALVIAQRNDGVWVGEVHEIPK
ncbi:carbon-nitrogen hydrolase family protein [Pseudoalteromonas luteoviolacea]|uniref:CN hydrolase domain-containing protein n=1 Tax=Pseudoalteromonas luteoviolacea S4054 TaxID=1129367 RepID=A0A0F6AEC2_9GAMM|nr:carbon-nitrogen hydrolase family protein [Pseudoalteromonas luteoviolacea]AOT08121.1 hypothetical protein S4054249_09810 [Pseudoalteromonas luteoviolacea]AOT13038.1 hypothetical protein S40542_09810 [Pseudoalteromonas luteoviolacea]AOT17950.1 hypothetical protein S4054_09805 [Pseudoalteromonas luteoviolacea]KKE84508.1 hypothetical protein N479_08780 [Pseudoalteromonas luteoviolacea S4054]KZN69518.1 hypothetical protein N481_22260 [Pseudoalteromonas luteoviolacea S4047-1]